MNLNVTKETENLYNSLIVYSHMRKNLSTEDMPVILKNISNFFIDKVDKIKNLFSINTGRNDKFDLNTGLNVFVKDLYKLKDKAIKIGKKRTMSEVESLNVPSVPGLVVTLPELCSNLQLNLQILHNKMYSYLDQLDTLVQQVLADKDFRESTKPIKPNLEIERDENGAYSQLNKVVSSKKLEDITKVRDLVPNLSSIANCVETLYSIGNGINLDNLNKVREKTQEIVKNIGKIGRASCRERV